MDLGSVTVHIWFSQSMLSNVRWYLFSVFLFFITSYVNFLNLFIESNQNQQTTDETDLIMF